MTKILIALTLVAGLAFSLSLAAQTTPESPTGSMQQDSQPPSLASSVDPGENKIAGCLRNENGKFVLRGERDNKKTWLSGPVDFASHSGHTVTLYGNFLNTSASKGSANSQPKNISQSQDHGTDFHVSRIEMMSPTCNPQKSRGSKPSGPRQH